MLFFTTFLWLIKQVFYKERLNGYYGVGVYVVSNFLSSCPFLALMSLATATIVYFMVKFRPEFPSYLYFALDLLSCIATVESAMMIVASLVPNFLMGVTIGAGYLVTQNTKRKYAITNNSSIRHLDISKAKGFSYCLLFIIHLCRRS